MPRNLRVASVNVNGIRAAARKGMLPWLETADVDVLTLQEVRGEATHLADALPGWHIVNDEALAKGRAGVAIAAREPIDIWRIELGDDTLDSRGRWVEADIDVAGEKVTIVSAYVHTGEADTEKQVAKYAFLDAMESRMPKLGELALITGDLNVGHRELDIRNWRGNVKKAGFLPRERAYFDRFTGPEGEQVVGTDGTTGTGLGWVDVGRRWAGEVDGPYSWWSNRGKAFDTDTGWRIDYHLASFALAERVVDYRVVRAPSWDTRWSDHAPVVADYAF
ncbi:exodeoxyribonuclease III [Microbacterium laevaniformans]|mgnify:CR=1 FL=1|uniref:exodeoxyribonuclease III n=1 Tax=Microbacterium TaxID=33882 RepID=UPI00044C3542|nr:MULTISPECIES: exodeoxyribonuclease III [Microbacterium]EXJ51608.1 exodeoxyribonuclease III [Microbacterium sp. MRS-1]MBM7751732.1 exodeoxyribonuclease-3 [Microbacterium laevaniformans]ODT24370.1 MAG: exodeoxyribonuclease III [Microbacterium sp. SCN 69-37]OJU46129.1 MAG: exodeoxyribonuclease III [Microbacterium sp. 69-7]GLJ63916.1 exodeoxyribonuclease III [Microbacterium laevaniformans]